MRMTKRKKKRKKNPQKKKTSNTILCYDPIRQSPLFELVRFVLPHAKQAPAYACCRSLTNGHLVGSLWVRNHAVEVSRLLIQYTPPKLIRVEASRFVLAHASVPLAKPLLIPPQNPLLCHSSPSPISTQTFTRK